MAAAGRKLQAANAWTNAHMNSPVTHRELDAKLETLEVRLDGRIGRIEDSVRVISDAVKEIRADQQEMRADQHAMCDEMRADREGMRTEFRASYNNLEQKFSNLKIVVVTTALASVIAIILGVSGFNAALTSNMLAAFQAGWKLHPDARNRTIESVDPRQQDPVAK